MTSAEQEELAGLVESIVGWARGALAGGRRPYGIDQFDLTLAFHPQGQKGVRRLAFDRLRPIDLYQDAFPERLLGIVGKELAGVRSSALSVSAALFSWGEAAHQALA